MEEVEEQVVRAVDDVTLDHVVHRSETYTDGAFAKMAGFRERNQFTDIVLVAGNKRIPAHKVKSLQNSLKILNFNLL